MKKYLLIWIFLISIISCGLGVMNEEAFETLEADFGNWTVTVFPINVVAGKQLKHDTGLSEDLVKFLGEQGIAETVRGDEPLHYLVPWGRDQSKMLRTSALQYAEMVKQKQLSTDYALVVEILLNSREDWVGGVHYYILTNEGKIAYCCLSNSHWDNYKSVNPKSRKDGMKVLYNMLKEKWPKIKGEKRHGHPY